MEAGVVDEVVGEGDIDRSKALEEVAAAEGEAEPQPFGAGLGEEGAAGEALGVEGVAEVKVADVADVLDVAEEKGDDAATEVEEIERWLRDAAQEAGEREVAGEGFAGEAADDDLFVRGGHVLVDRTGWGASLANCRMAQEAEGEKAAYDVVKSLMLCYTYLLCLSVMILINA